MCAVGVASQDVGFQNASQFATDLRGSGMLGPLCMLYFCNEHSSLLKGVWVRDPTDPAAFPFAVISLNATVLALRAMEGKTLHRMAAASSMLQAFMQVSDQSCMHCLTNAVFCSGRRATCQQLSTCLAACRHTSPS